MMRGNYRGLFAQDRPDVVTGVLWIRDCKITNDGTRVRFELAGNGWQWVDQSKQKAGGKFVVRQYVKFGVHVVIPGALDIAYDRASHVVSMWFTPTQTPQVQFSPIGGVAVDEKGLWSKVIGAVSSLVMESPDEQGTHEAKQQGTQQFANELSDGMTVAVDLCTGYQRVSLGRPQKGALGKPNPGESHRVPIELQPGGVMVFGEYLAPHGMRVDLHSDGAVRVGLACADDVARISDAFVNDRDRAPVPTLAQALIQGEGHLKIKPTSCKVALVAQAVEARPITFDWRRPPSESARATGGPAIRCGTLSPTRDGGLARPAATRRR